MGFIILLVLTTLAIAGCAAFFSVFGLAQIFTGAYWSVVLMGSSLEAGKLVAASFLYRYWTRISKPMRAYLFSAVIILMGITSMGIFGYLSNAFQDNILPYQQQAQQIELLQTDKAEAEKLKAERLVREAQINKQIADLPSNYVNGRNRLMAANKEELAQIRKDVAGYTQQIRDNTTKLADAKSQVLKETAHVGPIVFIAEVFGADVSQATKWLILVLNAVFDPLAVVLTICINIAIIEYKKERKPKFEYPQVMPTPEQVNAFPFVEMVSDPDPVVVPEPIVEADPVPVVEEPIVMPEPDGVDDDQELSDLQKAAKMFDKKDLNQHERAAKDVIEQTIQRYSALLNPYDRS